MLHWCLANGGTSDELTEGGNMTPSVIDLCFAMRYATACAETSAAMVEK